MSLEEKSGEKILDDVHEFCDKNDICKLDMEDEYIDPKNLELQTTTTIR